MGIFDRFTGHVGLDGLSLAEKAKLLSATMQGAKTGRTRHTKPGESDVLAVSREMAIDLFAAIEREPDEWVYYWRITNCLMDGKRYVEAFEMASRAARIRPDDPRSTYALGSVYRRLCRAKFLYPPYLDDAEAEKMVRDSHGEIDPPASGHALDVLGLTLVQAAEGVAACFAETLRLGVGADDNKRVRNSLGLHLDEFPGSVPLVRQILATNGST